MYDCIIAGGGLAGLSLAIQLADAGKSVLLIEKKTYPYHKVCGEYLSMENKDFLLRLGIDLSRMNLPQIRNFMMSSVTGKSLKEKLDLGGIGISRFTLDHLMYQLALNKGVEVMQETQVLSYARSSDSFTVQANKGNFHSRILVASFGKLAPGNFNKADKLQENWVGIKYHIRIDGPDDQIALHTFIGGYCGISKIEDEKYCLCYLVKADVLKQCGNSIPTLEQTILMRNPHLREIFSQAEFLFDKPKVISNITFGKHKPVLDGVFYVGDAAGTIAPLSGNGMSMALRASSLLAPALIQYLDGQISLPQLEEAYLNDWNRHFQSRIHTGNWLQYWFCQSWLTGFFISFMRLSASLRRNVIRRTHGEMYSCAPMIIALHFYL
ncbi:MAG: NAD(P)/FAD-dependent oxidoreductase [Chitinophagaceae bacterium]|nr:NAD(P)/FAD-dependent oxidoreductase [Chitinophagaceae bacterium]